MLVVFDSCHHVTARGNAALTSQKAKVPYPQQTGSATLIEVDVCRWETLAQTIVNCCTHNNGPAHHDG